MVVVEPAGIIPYNRRSVKRRRIEAVIFDVDGVLFDSEPLHVRAWEEVFSRLGVVLWESDYVAGVGVADADFLAGLKENGRLPADADIPAILREKEEALGSLADGASAIFPGVQEMIRDLACEYQLCAASNSAATFVRKMMETAGLSAHFAAIVCPTDGIRPKPAPDIYLRASELLGVFPSACAVVEDSAVGVKAAKAAGMYCIGVGTSLSRELLCEAGAFLERLTLAGLRDVLS